MAVASYCRQNCYLDCDHNAVVAYTDHRQCLQVKTSTKRIYRRKTPSQHASFLQYAASVDFDIAFTGSDADVQSQFYSVVLNLLGTFYPESSVTITSHDPSYILPSVL